MAAHNKFPLATLLVIWLVIFAPMAKASGNTNAAVLGDTSEFQRTTNCVYGGLPMDVQFDVPTSPPRIDGRGSLGEDEIKQLGKALDPRIALLLRDAFTEAVSDQPKDGTLNFGKVSLAFEAALQNRAGQQLNLNFCGDHAKVGNTIIAAISGWFSRAVNHASSSSPLTKWFQQIDDKAPAHEVEFVILATADQLSNSKVSIAALLNSFKASLSSGAQH